MAHRLLRLRPTLLVWVALLLVVTLGTITSVVYLRTQAAIEQLVRQQLAAATEAARSEVSAIADTAISMLNELDLLALQGVLRLDDREALAPLLVERVRQEPVIGWFGFGNLLDDAYVAGNRAFEDGSIRVFFAAPAVENARPFLFEVDSSGSQRPIDVEDPEPYLVSTRPWVQPALAREGIVWNEPFLFTDGMLGVAAVIRVPLPEASPPVDGVFHVDFFLRDLHEFLRAIEVGETGRVFVVTGNGTLIGVGEDERPRFESAAAERAAGSGILTLDDTAYRTAWSPLGVAGGPDWRIGILVPERELTGIVGENARTVLLAGLLALAIALGLAAWLAHLISRPIRAMSEDVEHVSHFDITDDPPIDSWIREIAVLGDAIDHMKLGLKSFEKYVPGEVVRKLIAARKEAVLGVEPAEVTLLFSDIKGFTGITESLEPDRLVEVVGEYLEEMSQVVIASDATLDKYIGDAIMAFWNAPTPVPDHPAVACRAALTYQRRLAELREVWRARDLPPLRARIGLNTGHVLVGNLGSERRLSYTVIGDAVNLAARLEALNDSYGTLLIISDSVKRAIGDAFVTRPLDLVAVKGKTEGILVHELITEREHASSAQIANTALYASALDEYLGRRFEQARAMFREYLDRRPGDVAAGLLADRCDELLRHPPDDDWNGVFVMQSK
ncbi:MAG: adenylate/guanylate cyclase domain-containing protein [Pseudomonadota bacterium]